MTSQLPCYEAKCVQRRCFKCGSVPLRSDIKGTELPPANILIPLERQLIALQLCRWHFLYNETLQRTFRPLLSKLSKRRQIWALLSPFGESYGRCRTLVDGSLESPCRVLVKFNWTSFSMSYGWGATRQKVSRLAAIIGGGRSVRAKISVEAVVPAWGIFLVSTKLDTFCYPTVQTAPCYVPSFWHNTGVWQTDGQTYGIAVASTALAKRRAVNTWYTVIAIWQQQQLALL